MTEYQHFIVIRHGESETNATNTFQAGNQYDSDPLTPLGAEDATHLAQRLALLPVDLVVSSSYLRARTTAVVSCGTSPSFLSKFGSSRCHRPCCAPVAISP